MSETILISGGGRRGTVVQICEDNTEIIAEKNIKESDVMDNAIASVMEPSASK